MPTEDKVLGLLLDGVWQTGGGRDTRPVVNPATGETIADLVVATAADVDTALGAADRAFARWRSTDAAARAAILHEAAVLIRTRLDLIATLLTREQGKPLAEARSEVIAAALMFDWYAEEALRNYGRVLVRPSGERAIVIRQPVGVVAALSPWNFPVYLLAKKLAPAIAAGCTVIAKPPEEAPASASALVRCLVDAGLPSGVLQMVFGVPDDISRRLIASDIVRKVSFTGSVPVGQHLMRLSADGVKRITLELGGHAPVLIFADCDLDKTLDQVVAQKFRNAGQVCVSPTRFYVEEAIYDKFLAGFAARTTALRVGDGLDPASLMGPLANVRRPVAVEKLVSDATAKGARLLAGGERLDRSGFFYRPTLLADVPLAAEVMTSEPFGPVAVAAPFATVDEAIEQANRLPYGLAAFVFTENGRRANILSDAIEAGMVGINTFAVSVADAPFGGVKLSGFGSEGGTEGFDSYTVVKAVHQA